MANKKMQEVVMVLGYPASGKSTISEWYVNQGFVCLNRDTTGGKIADLVPMLDQYLAAGRDVVLDNTFPTIEVRKPFIEVANKHNVELGCSWLQSTIEEAQFNACMRMMDRVGRILGGADFKTEKDPNLFPPVVLFKYKKEFQKPTKAEGFKTVDKTPFDRDFPSRWITNPQTAVIFDYDDTLRTSVGEKKWPIHPDDVKILPGRKEKLQQLQRDGVLILGASNQSGVAKDLPTDEQARACFDKTNKLLGMNIDYKYCPHKVPPISCFCRKPMPGMAIELFWKYNLLPSRCLMVGDSTSDKTFAKRALMGFVHSDDYFK